MKTTTSPTVTNEALALLVAKLRDDYTPIDREALFDAMLDECYSFDAVGGPFAHMLPSRVLRDQDPTAYRCGVNDYIDGLDVSEVDGDEWNDTDIEEAREAVISELETDLESVVDDEAEANERQAMIESVKRLEF